MEQQFRWDLRVFSTDIDRATVYVRKHRFEVGAPIHFDQDYGSVTSLEYILAAIGADIVNGMRALCHRRRVEVDRIEALVSGEVDNPLVHLGVVGEEGHPGIKKVVVKVYVGSFEAEDRVRQVWGEMLSKSPVANTFGDSLSLDLQIIT